MQFQVPQFTETETKVVGPLTIKQFIWLALAGLAIFIMSYIVTAKALIVFSVIAIGLAVAFAFINVQNVSLIRYLGYALRYFLKIEKYSYGTTEKRDYLPPEQHGGQY